MLSEFPEIDLSPALPRNTIKEDRQPILSLFFSPKLKVNSS